MAYKRKSLQILGGGFNLLPPVDKVPATDYLQACNWRVDRTGKLASRFGYPSKFSIASAGLAHSAFVNGGIYGTYYVGCNSAINSPTGSLYWNFNATAIATGFDGNRIGLACMNGRVYVMNRAKQGYSLASAASQAAAVLQTWNLSIPGVNLPGNSPTAAAAAGPSTVASATYNYTLQGNSAYIHYLNIAGNIYQFAENGYSAGQLPLVISVLAAQDPNCTVTYSGTGSAVVITPIVANTLVQVSGSDGNAAANLANGAVTSLPNGTYQFYVTFESTDETLESNPSPVSNPVALASQSVTLTNISVSSDSRVGIRNIYAVGGTLGQPYQVTTIGDNVSTSWTFSFSDLAATDADVVMPTNNDPPPAASGIVGPYFSRLIAFSTAANPNRLFWTDPDLPQYWPGSTDPAEGNWVDVGAEGEAILWSTAHTNCLVIYKERSIWMLVGDPDTGYLQQVSDAHGLSGAFAVTTAGAVDYFVGPGGLYRFDLSIIIDMSGEIRPLFQAGITGGPLLPPGSILPGTAYNSNSIFPYALALGYAMGKLYIGYAEATGVGTSYCTLVYHEESKKWFYHRNAVAGSTGFFGFVFDGAEMVGLTGTAGGAAEGLNLDDFRNAGATDAGGVALALYYQSHYEDAGEPDLQKKWLEVVLDYEFAGDTASVYVGFDAGANLTAAAYGAGTTYAISQWCGSGGVIYQSLQGNNKGNTPATSPLFWMPVPNSPGTITGTARQQTSFPLGIDGVLAKNISVEITAAASHLLIIHNVYLYYYEEARLAVAASTLPTDLGVGKVKQCKELELDIDASSGNVGVNIYTDMPGNALAVRQTPTVTANSGRAVMRYPLLGTAGPPPTYTEGYLWRVALTAAAGPFRLYAARLLMRVMGVYVEAYEAAGGYVWDSMETTFSTALTKIPRTFQIALAMAPIKRAREIRLQIDTFNAAVTLTLLSDLPGGAQAVVFTSTINTGTAGRRFWPVMLPNGMPGTPWIEGRMFRLQLSGVNKFVLYEALMEIQPYGIYLEAIETSAGAIWDSLEVDLGSQQVKQFREVELDLWAYGAYTVVVYTDLPGNAMATARVTSPQAATTTRATVQIPLPQGAVPDNYIFGRLVRVVITSASAIKLFGARIHARPIGVYAESYEAEAGAVWDSMAQDLGNPNDKYFDQARFEMDTDAAAAVAIYTDLPGESMAIRATAALTTTATSRHWATVPLTPGPNLPFTVEGRSIRTVVSSTTGGFRIYRAQVRSCRIGRYLAAVTPSAAQDSFNTLEFDFANEGGKVKEHKKLEIDVAADGTLAIALFTEQTGQLAQAWTQTVTTHNGRMTFALPLTPGIRGRLLRIALTSPAAARVFKLRVWSRALNEPKAEWGWTEYPLENADALPTWSDIPVPPTPADFAWAQLPVMPTPPPAAAQSGDEWTWAKFLQVEETPDEWTWIDVPFEVVGA